MDENIIRIILDLTKKSMGYSRTAQPKKKVIWNPVSRNKLMIQVEKYEPMIVDPCISTNMPATYLEKRKEAIFSCPKSSTIKYLPPSVSDTALLRLREVPFSDLATTVLQLRIYNVHKEINLAEKSLQIFELGTKPLTNPEALYISYIKKCNKKSWFGRRKKSKLLPQLRLKQQIILNDYPAVNNQQKFWRRSCGRARGNIVSPSLARFLGKADKRTIGSRHCREMIQNYVQESEYKQAKEFNKKNFYKFQMNRGGKDKNLWLLQSTVCNTKKIRRTQTSSWIEEAEPKSSYLYQNFAPSIGMSEIPENKNLGILGQSLYYREDKRKICSWISDKLKEISNYSNTNDHTLRNDNKFIRDPAIQNLALWKMQLTTWNEQQFLTDTPKLKFFTDISDIAWTIASLEALLYINAKELLTTLYAPQSRSFVGRSVLIYSENTTTLSYVKKFGGTLVKNKGRRSKTKVEKPILLLTLEPENTSGQKGTPEENNTDNFILVLKDLNLVFGPTGTIYPTTIASTSNHSNSGPKKRKVTLHKKQSISFDGM
ncbi:hypothetical protein BB561_004063 [Smittium simulii]|uniref:Uncharacterized protein n=1 Tax=Smittium simulii TaxID=133385 RepID=A0A2T9YIA6_9FUNG|nr:hypothetical protein BB561_004063 [Smittium simulii]